MDQLYLSRGINCLRLSPNCARMIGDDLLLQTQVPAECIANTVITSLTLIPLYHAMSSHLLDAYTRNHYQFQTANARFPLLEQSSSIAYAQRTIIRRSRRSQWSIPSRPVSTRSAKNGVLIVTVKQSVTHGSLRRCTMFTWSGSQPRMVAWSESMICAHAIALSRGVYTPSRPATFECLRASRRFVRRCTPSAPAYYFRFSPRCPSDRWKK